MNKAVERMRIARERKEIKKQIKNKGFGTNKLKQHNAFKKKVALSSKRQEESQY